MQGLSAIPKQSRRAAGIGGSAAIRHGVDSDNEDEFSDTHIGQDDEIDAREGGKARDLPYNEEHAQALMGASPVVTRLETLVQAHQQCIDEFYSLESKAFQSSRQPPSTNPRKTHLKLRPNLMLFPRVRSPA